MQALGTLGGAGAMVLDHGTITSVPGDLISVATLEIDQSTLVAYAGETFSDTLLLYDATLPLFDSTLTVTNAAALYATIPDTGTIVIAAGALADASQLVMQGTSDDLQILGTARLITGNIVQSDTTSIVSIAATGTVDFDNDVNMLAGTLMNAGLLEKTGGSGQSRIIAAFSSTGTIMVAAGGTLFLDDPVVDLAGTVTGQGVFDTQHIGSNDTTTLQPGLFVNTTSRMAACSTPTAPSHCKATRFMRMIPAN
jgi:hypothetical protein